MSTTKITNFENGICVSPNKYKDIHEAISHIGHFITQVYKRKRLHSALGNLTPIEFQRKNLS